MGDITPDVPQSILNNAIQGIQDVEFKVLVTGYGPFHLKFPINSSWSIASTLPESLPATTTCPRIKLIIPPEPIEVSYRAVQSFAEQWLENCEYDLILHIGLAAGRPFFTLEQQSMREPYWEKKDVDGVVFSKQETEALWPVDDFPPILKPTFDCNDVWLRWRWNITDEHLDIRPSDDPGNYLCGFIYYYSMAWFWGRECKERPVIFLHVPDLPSEEKIAGGREVAIGLIRAMVESRLKKGACDPLKGDVIDQPMGAAETVGESVAGEADMDMAWTYQR